MSKRTVAQVEADLRAEMQAGFSRLEGLILARLEPTESARVTPTRSTRKAPSKARKTRKAPARKGSVVKSKMTVTQQGRKSWNDTFSTLVRTSGLRFGKAQVSLYRYSMDHWGLVTVERNQGRTPAEAVDLMISLAKSDF